jgi:glucose-1-phosphate thymidylyltransferase
MIRHSQTVEQLQALKVACLEEIGWNKGWISDAQLARQGDYYQKTQYGQYLLGLLQTKGA